MVIYLKLHKKGKIWWKKTDVFAFVNTKMWDITLFLFLLKKIKHIWSTWKIQRGHCLQISSSLTTETRALLISDPITGARPGLDEHEVIETSCAASGNVQIHTFKL